jgi:diguanylate cyclase (GGDEF)-like protein
MSVLLVNMAKERAELLQRQTSLVDPLTGVANRRAFFDRAEALLRRASADGLACALLVFDLDRFKAVNDTYGHQAGDRVLAKFCDVARAILRPQDPFGRFGGEEFACLLVDVSLGDALRTADRVRTAFATAPFALGLSKAGVTVSVGIAMSGETEQSLQTLFASADRSLYSAKAKGRNRVEAARKPLQVIEGAGAAAI